MEEPQVLTLLLETNISENKTGKENANVFEQLCEKDYAQHKKEEKRDSDGLMGIEIDSETENLEEKNNLDKFNVESQISNEDIKENEEEIGENKENEDASDENKENEPVAPLLKNDESHAVLQNVIINENMNEKSEVKEEKENMESESKVIIVNGTDNTKFENEKDKTEKVDISKDETASLSNSIELPVDDKNIENPLSTEEASFENEANLVNDISTSDAKDDSDTFNLLSSESNSIDLNDSSNGYISNDFAVAEGSRLDTQYDVVNELNDDDDSRLESNIFNSEDPQNECDRKESTVIGDDLVTGIIPNNILPENVDDLDEVSDTDGDFDNDSLDDYQPDTDVMKDSLEDQLEDKEMKEPKVMEVQANPMKDSLEKGQIEDKEIKEPQVAVVPLELAKLTLMSSSLRGSVESLKSVTSVKSVQSLKNAESKTLSPKFKRRLRTFSNSSGKRDSGDFTIEIFESKRRPQDSPLKQSIPTSDETVNKADDKVETSAKVDIESADKCQSDNSDNKGSSTVNNTELVNPQCPEPIAPSSGCLDEVSENVTNLDHAADSSDAPPATEEQQLQLTDTLRKNSDNNSHKNPSPEAAPSSQVVHNKSIGGGGAVQENAVSEVRQGGQATEEPTTTKKPTPMAFTIDLGTETEEGTDQGNKKLEINASISKWAPKHRRNLSLSKVEENKKVEERGKPPVGRPRSGTLGSTTSSSVNQAPPQRRATGYHSEGYFSSDQDDEPRRTDLKSPRSPRTPEARSPMAPQRVMRSASNDSARGASLRMRSPSPDMGSRIPTVSNDLNMTLSLNESASLLLGRIIANTPEPKRKLSNISGKSEGSTSTRQCCLGEKKPTVAELIGSYKSSKKDSKAGSEKMSPTARNQSVSVQSLTSCHTYDVNQEEDNVSEAGTYTIGNESPDVEKARSNIDNVFGVPGTGTESDADAKAHKSSAVNVSRASPNWIQQWAAQVAEHTNSPSSPVTSPQGTKPPVTSPSPESNAGRPRRKLPTVPTGQPASPQSSLTITSPRASDFSDVESASKARVDITSSSTAANGGLPGSPFTSQDSGGDSDIDTLTSYPQTDNDTRLSQAIRNKLKLSNLESTTKPKQLGSIPSRTEVNLQGRLKLALRRERSTMSDVGYDSFAAVRQEEHCMQSDSSSETSDNIKEGRKTAENNPPLKYNRAFSLRRGRLDESPASTPDKTKPSRASNATSGSGRSKAPLTSSKSVQGDYSKHIPSKPQAGSPKGAAKDMTREDGGRFSLRANRSASTASVSKSPPRKNLKKDLLKRAIPSRSNSTLTSKEAEFQNWKRRKNYDPMKAAAEGRKKQADKKVEQPNEESRLEGTPSPQLLRSQSFHGTEGMVAGRKWPQKGNHYDDDEPSSLTEDEAANIPQSSPLRRCPTSPHTLASPTHSTSPARQAQLNAANAARRRASYTLSDDGEGNNTSGSRKTSFDESESEGKSSPMGSTRGGGRAKVKMEALDNLVISTIHSLSVKVRGTSETLLQKLRSQYDEEGDRAALLEEVLAHLTESDQTLTKSQTRSTSRELAGILRNLKKIEHALEVIDRVLVYDDEEEDLEEELDGTVCNEWSEDY